MAWIIGVDVGGTFTDFIALDEERGTVHLHKTLSTPENPARAILDGLQTLARERNVPLEEVAHLAHGTTVGTNALIQRQGAAVALITTEGFRDLLEIGRQTRPKLYDLQVDHPPPLVPRKRRFEVSERLGAKGEVVNPIDLRSVEAAAAAVKSSGADACAVCFLFSFLNADHERRTGDALSRLLPDMYVSLSCDVHPEFREYERLSTTVLNAYLQPVMSEYIQDLGDGLGQMATAAEVGINQSSGGLMSIGQAKKYPVRTVLSGPAAGVVGAAHLMRLSDRPNVITLDMGGTSADVCLIRDYEAGISFTRDVAGFPVRLPMVDINTVGAGGGSIAWFDRDGLLKVGPASAGADPGPACYGRGGDQATVSDANAVLGRLSPAGLLGGAMRLDVDAARRVIVPIADRLERTIEQAAQGILSIVASNMVRAVRTISVERGHDPRDFTLVPFGGAGALHAADVARALGVREVLVPLSPGILCAQGLVASDYKEDFVASARLPLDEIDRVRTLIDGRVRDAQDWLGAQSGGGTASISLALDMRYVGQNFELTIAVGEAHGRGREPDVPSVETLEKRFRTAHEANYGYSNPTDPIEIVNIRVTGKMTRPGGESLQATTAGARKPDRPTARPVFFGGETPTETPVFPRDGLRPGDVVEGPAIIDQFDATTVVHPGDRATVDSARHLVIEIAP